jgi:hypothetical protein
MRVLTVLMLGLALTGCGTLYDAPPERPMKLASEPSQKWCDKAHLLFGDPLLDADSRQAVLEAMKNHGCVLHMWDTQPRDLAQVGSGGPHRHARPGTLAA